MNDIKELFEDSPIFDTDGMQLVDIDLDGIDTQSKQDAADMVENLSKFYYDEEFMRKNPTFKKRVDEELESLRVLIKMRKTDEVAHDLIIKAIAGNSNNASLYRSLTEIQKTILSITTKMGEIITGLNTFMKGYQLELNFDNDSEKEEVSNDSSGLSRGTKDFIERMNSIDLFDDNKNEDE